MTQPVFYSWQSDTPAPINRTLIEVALERALRSLRQSDAPMLEPTIDRDTAGVPGAPSIADTIFDKIALASAFVADVTIINAATDERPTPNPNILIELGYAVAELGWERIILVQNTAFGGPEKLPFDLRGRRVITYHLSDQTQERTEARGLLQGRLEAAVRTALSDTRASPLYAGPHVPLWFGTWRVDSQGGMHGGVLEVVEAGPTGFLFSLLVYNGSHTGTIDGFARITSPDVAYAAIPTQFEGGPCLVSFRRRIENDRRTISIDESGGCMTLHGMGAPFFGTFVRERDWLFDSARLDELDLARLKRMWGRHYDAFRLRFQGISEVDNLDPVPGTVISGGVRGLYTTMEGILLRGARGEMCAAFIDDDVVRYTSNIAAYANRLPATFEKWRERFASIPVEYHHTTELAPRRAWEESQ